MKLRGKTRAELLAVRGDERTSLFIKRGRKIEYVKLGSMYSNKHDDSSVETARIIGMRTDTSGTAHVSYEVIIARRQIAGL